ncbi:MAG: nuclear transport factor 2 family protein [Pseudomonadota bacterium]
MPTTDTSRAKALILNYQTELERAGREHRDEDGFAEVIAGFAHEDLHWYGVHPFGERHGSHAVARAFWAPLCGSFERLQRRQDIFFAGRNASDDALWVVSMGHLMGLFDRPFLGIPPTGRVAMLRYAEFCHVTEDRIARASLFVDLIGLMQQSGLSPLPAATGQHFVYPGPRTHDGLQLADADPVESAATLSLIDRMVDDLSALNLSGEDRCPPEYLARTWHDDMLWYGPAGIGATYTIERYQAQHQYPFRTGLTDKVFNGHICRCAEGNYGGFFGWPNLTNRAAGGFLGLPASDKAADMRVVDIYRRDGDKLAENWVLIDLPHWLLQQGVNVLERSRELTQASFE